MTPSRLLYLVLVLPALSACHDAELTTAQRHLEQLCEAQPAREEYLDFYWDHLRSHQPELWDRALATCRETCPRAVNCGPVLSVASWYEKAPTADPLMNSRSLR